MMISLTPNSRPEDHNGVVEVIKLLSDGPAYQKRFDEIKQMADLAEKKIRAARQLEEKYANAEKMMADATAVLAQHRTRATELDRHVHGARIAELDQREASIAERKEKFKTLVRGYLEEAA